MKLPTYSSGSGQYSDFWIYDDGIGLVRGAGSKANPFLQKGWKQKI
jgi:hypothetical protein